MMLHKNSSRASLLKLLALVPIVGVALALQAETVNEYVFTEKTQNPPQKIVKKGKANKQVKIGNKTIEVKAEQKAEQNQPSPDAKPLIIIPSEMFTGNEPLFVLDGQVATKEQVKALNPNEISDISVVKPESSDVLKAYGKHFNAKASNGIVFIRTKAFAENPDTRRTAVLVGVKAKSNELEEAAVQGDIAIGAIDYDEPEKPFDVVEQMPEFPGGMPELMKFLQENVKYPEEAMKNGIQGRVLIQFIVEKDGSISEAKVIKKVNELLDAEALRVIGEMPKWTPGKQKGQEVRVKFVLPVTFRLS